MSNIIFEKTSKEIKSAISKWCKALKIRLDKRNEALDSFIGDQGKVRSYMIRNSAIVYHGASPTLYSKEHLSKEEVEEITQLCRRVFELEQEIDKLTLLAKHMDDEKIFELSILELNSYGFD